MCHDILSVSPLPWWLTGPDSAIPPVAEVKAQCYMAIMHYTADRPAQISFGEGEALYVLDKLEDGVWT